MGALPEVLADRTGPVGDYIEEGAPRIEHYCSAGRQLAGDMGHMEGNAASEGVHRPRILAGMGSRCRERPEPKTPEAAMLAVHDAITINSLKAQQTLSKLVNQGRYATHASSLEELPETVHPPRIGRPDGWDRDQSLRQGSL